MRRLQMLWARVKGQAAQGREDKEFNDEILEHLDLLEERYKSQGMNACEAAEAARRQFGNVTSLREQQRSAARDPFAGGVVA